MSKGLLYTMLILMVGGMVLMTVATRKMGEQLRQKGAPSSGITKSVPTTQPLPRGKKLNVVASGYVAYTLARQMGGDKINISMLAAPGSEPHSFEPTPGSIVLVNDADIFVYISLRIEPWVASVLAGAKKNLHVVEAASVTPAEADPHVWMDFDNAYLIAEYITDILAQQDPSNKKYFQTNLRGFKEEIALLKQEYARRLAYCESRTVIHMGHMAFRDLAKNYNLELKTLRDPAQGEKASVKTVADLINAIKKEEIRSIFTEEMISQNLTNTIAKETGAKIFLLYPIEQVTRRDFENHQSYFGFMRLNLNNLVEGLVCSEQPPATPAPAQL